MGAGPQGGPRDYTPPKCKKSTPKRSAVNVKPKEVDIYFDEYVEIKDAMKIVVSPPSETPPEIKAVGKKVIVEFRDTLKPNSTYIIDFGTNIQDFREGNPTEDYYFEFSTGAEIDSFMLSGYVVDAETLVPMEGVTVGVYAECNDTTFATTPFDCIGKTDAEGHFMIRGLKNQPYHIFAAQDDNGNFHFDAPSEFVAFMDATVTPQRERKTVSDTTYKIVNKDSLLGKETDNVNKDTTIIDSIKTRQVWRYFPDSLELSLFQKHIPHQAFGKVSRKTEKQIVITMENEKPQIPIVRVMRNTDDTIVAMGAATDSTWCVREVSQTTDTITYWVKDSTLMHGDTITLEITYLVTDSIGEFVSQTDTITALYKHTRKEKKEADKKANDNKKKKSNKKAKSELTAKITGVVGIGLVPEIEWTYPCVNMKAEAVKVYLKDDTLKKDIAHTIEPIDGMRRYKLNGKWEEGQTYCVVIDSGLVGDIYGNVCDSTGMRFRIKDKSEMSNFTLNIEGHEPGAYVVLMDKQGNAVKKVKAEGEKVVFENLDPNTYSVMMYIDANGDGEWTTGDYEERRQPEKVYFFGKTISMSKNWDYEERWNVKEKMLHEQRPQDSYPQKSKKRR